MDSEADQSVYAQNPVPLGSGMEGLERRSVEWPQPSSMPLILDTDIGGVPDDALALAIAAGIPTLSLVITSDEHGGRRARLARCLLDLLGRADVPVVAGVDLGNDHHWAAEGLVPDRVAAQPTDVGTAVADVLEQSDGQVGWIGLGPMSNLARVLGENPGTGDRLVVTQQEGASKFAEDRPQQNIELDIPAAQQVLESGIQLWIMPANVSFHPFNALTEDSIEYTVLDRSIDPARILLRLHMDLWFTTFSKYITLHGPITLSHGIGMPFVTATSARVSLDESGRVASGERKVFMAQSADYDMFRRWLVDRMELVESELARHPAVDYGTDK